MLFSLWSINLGDVYCSKGPVDGFWWSGIISRASMMMSLGAWHNGVSTVDK
jgi:hypothetical protein